DLLEYPSNVWVTRALYEKMDAEIKDANCDSRIKQYSNIPINRSFVVLDVSDYSTYSPGQQVLIVNSLAEIFNNPSSCDCDADTKQARDDVEALLCIGDGYIYVMRDALNAARFAAHLANLIEELVARKWVPVRFHFRMGVHVGPVYRFHDPGR